ncbi:MAG TPA: DUF4114 domain-containing protein [Gammaproteobacteria bacterium]|nr:DUF4114 domain-containing protein [Gammaproteobacteria bacterium]
MITRASVLAVGLAASAVAGVAHATTTFVDPRGNFGNERCLYGNGLTCGTGGSYGGDISIIHAMEIDQDLAAGSIVRVDDDLDKLWESTIANGGQVAARARYAAHTLSLGFDAGGGYTFLMQNTGDFKVRVDNAADFAGTMHASDFQTWAATWTNVPLSAGADFAFVLRDQTSGDFWTSNNGGSGVGSAGYANSGGTDHMVAYKAGADHYFLGFEDLRPGETDSDFNDMVVEVRFIHPRSLRRPSVLVAIARA